MSNHFHQSPIVQNGQGNVVQVMSVESGEGKPLVQCTPAELRAERRHRARLLAQERSRQRWLLLRLLLWLLFGGGASHFSSLWLGWSHSLTLALAGFGVALPVALLHQQSQRGESTFALRQLATLQEIDFLLREKQGQ
jgi:hypothetical protein